MKHFGVAGPEAAPLFADKRRPHLAGWVAYCVGGVLLVAGSARLCQVLAARPAPINLIRPSAAHFATDALPKKGFDGEELGKLPPFGGVAELGKLQPLGSQLIPLSPLELKLQQQAATVLRAASGVETGPGGVVRWRDHKGQSFERYAPHSHTFAYVPPQLSTVAGHRVVNFLRGPEDVTGLVFGGVQLPQPLTLVVVASPGSGDATLVANAATGVMPRVAICHGWSKHGFRQPRIALTASGGGPDPLDPPERIIYGKTRDTKAWHVYTAVLDGQHSQLFVDGDLEGSGNAGSNGLEGLTVGGDQLGHFGLHGGVLEVWALPGVLPAADRTGLERLLHEKYAAAFWHPPLVGPPIGR